jgi:hypothetical protein
VSELLIVVAACGIRFVIFEMFESVPKRTVCRWKRLGKLCRCPFCQGFWVGLIVALIVTSSLLTALLAGFATAYVSYVVYITTAEGHDD